MNSPIPFPSIEDALSALFAELRRTHVTSYAQVAAVTCIAYDILIHFDLEYEFIWKSRPSLTKALYFIARYGGLFLITFLSGANATTNPSSKLYVLLHCDKKNLLDISIDRCHATVWLSSLDVAFSTGVVDLIMVLRINALYQRRRPIFVFLLSAMLIDVGLVLLGGITASKSIKSFLTEPLPGVPITGCIALQTPPLRLNLVSWISNAVFQFILFGMMMYRMIFMREFSRSHPNTIRLVFFRDGVIYYLVTLCTVIWGLVMEQVPSFLPYDEIPAVWINAIFCYSGAHLILNLRSSVKDNEDTIQSDTLEPVSTFRVAGGPTVTTVEVRDEY